jgi:protein TonB
MTRSAAAAVEPAPAAPASEEKVTRKTEADPVAASSVAMAFREPVAQRFPAGDAKAPSAPAAEPSLSGSGKPAATSSLTPEVATGGNAALAAKNQTTGLLPSVISGPPPVYPRDARSQGLTGKVRLRILISKQGTVQDVVIAHSSGHVSLDDAARHGLRHWRFNPAYQNGHAVAAWVVVPVLFKLD